MNKVLAYATFRFISIFSKVELYLYIFDLSFCISIQPFISLSIHPSIHQSINVDIGLYKVLYPLQSSAQIMYMISLSNGGIQNAP